MLTTLFALFMASFMLIATAIAVRNEYNTCVSDRSNGLQDL